MWNTVDFGFMIGIDGKRGKRYNWDRKMGKLEHFSDFADIPWDTAQGAYKRDCPSKNGTSPYVREV